MTASQIKYYPLQIREVTEKVEMEEDTFAMTSAPSLRVDENGLVWAQWWTRPGKLDCEVVGYQPPYLRGDNDGN